MIWSSSLLFLLTTLVGIWAAYDRSAAVGKFILIVVGLLLAWTIAQLSRRSKTALLTPMGQSCACLAGGIGLCFMLSKGIPALPLLSNNNLAASALVILIPLGVAGTIRTMRRGRRVKSGLLVSVLAIALGALFLTFSRGGWLGLLWGSTVAVYLHWRFGAGSRSAWMPVWDGLLMGGACLLVAVFMYVTLNPMADNALGRIFGEDGSLISRIRLWQDALLFFEDYRFTGGGLGSTAMVLSSYILLLNAPFYYHVHNLYLQVMAEHGTVGLIAFVGMLAATGWQIRSALAYGRRAERTISEPVQLSGEQASEERTRFYRRNRLFGAAAAGSLVALAVHGLLDSEIYVSSLLPLTFVPIGFAFGLPTGASASLVTIQGGVDTRLPLAKLATSFSIIAPFLVVSLLFLLPGTRAAFMVNLGAVAQTRAEMLLYTQWQWPIQDALRYDGLVDLQGATQRYGNALLVDPQNSAAHRRLGQIALSVGEFDAAKAHLDMAYQMNPHPHATRQMLGEVYAITGEPERAALLWSAPEIYDEQLHLRSQWYQQIRATQASAWIQESIASANR